MDSKGRSSMSILHYSHGNAKSSGIFISMNLKITGEFSKYYLFSPTEIFGVLTNNATSNPNPNNKQK